MGEGFQILSDTQGVDFSAYIKRLLDTLRRNWYSVMPESANMGDNGVVFTTFTIYPNGSVQAPDPTFFGENVRKRTTRYGRDVRDPCVEPV